MAVHPCTSQIADPDLPAVATLLDADVSSSPLRVAVATAGGAVETCQVTGVTWWPGTSIIVTYRVTISGGQLEGEHDLVATSGRRIPDGAIVVESHDATVAVWRIPHDPALPGLPAACNPVRAGALLVDLDVPGPPVTTRLQAYRPGRRGVVSVTGRSAREFVLAEMLFRHSGQVVSRQQILSHVWGYDFDPGSNVVDVYVGYLRRKLGRDLIETVRGMGYRLVQ